MSDTEQGLIWITGASLGIGRALALHMAGAGWRVAASARGAEALADLAAQNPRIHAFPLDITEPGAAEAALAAIEAQLGPLSVAVLNAGTYLPDPVDAVDLAGLERMTDLNLIGTVRSLEPVAARMVARGAGRIAVVSSVAGIVGLPGAAGYAATKAALLAYCEAMQPGLARAGVRLQVINPGFVDTPLTRKNTFPMPFLIPADRAAAIIARGLASNCYEITFPRPMALAMKLLAALPHRLRFALTRRTLPRSS